MIRTQILLTPNLYELLKFKAETEDRSLSAVIREALEKLLKRKKTGKEILNAMVKHSVSYPKAPKDLSTNDDYLYRMA